MHRCGQISRAKAVASGENKLGQRLTRAGSDNGRTDHPAPTVQHQTGDPASEVLGDSPVDVVVVHVAHGEPPPRRPARG